MRILVVDDDTIFQTFFSRMVNKAMPDVSVLQAMTVADAREYLMFQNFDVIVLDFLLPDGQATDLLFTLDAWYLETPVLIVSSQSQVNLPQIDAALMANSLGVFPKSIINSAFLNGILSSIKSRSADSANPEPGGQRNSMAVQPKPSYKPQQS